MRKGLMEYLIDLRYKSKPDNPKFDYNYEVELKRPGRMVLEIRSPTTHTSTSEGTPESQHQNHW